MKKKLLSLALVLVMALTLLPTAAFAAEDLPEPPGTEESAPGDALTNPPEIKEADPDASSDSTTPSDPDAIPGGSTTTPSAGTCTGQAGCTAATHNGHDIGHQDLADAQAEEDHSNQNSQHRRADETTEDTREITRQGPRQDLTVNRHYRADNEQG